MHGKHSAALGFALSVSISSARAQQLLREHHGSDPVPLGAAVVGLDDVDGDGVAEYAIAAKNSINSQLQGYVELRSGATGQVLHTFVSNPGEMLGSSLARLDDVNLDGVGDWCIGGSHRVLVISGASSSVLYSIAVPAYAGALTSGAAIAGLGDVDGDGRGDLLIGVSQLWTYFSHSGTAGAQYSGPGYIEVRSGSDGHLIRTASGSHLSDGFGGTVAPLGDVDNDGVDDYLASTACRPVSAHFNYVRLYSGRTGALVHEIALPSGFLRDGAVAGLDDVDGDGSADFAIGEPSSARVRILSGATAQTLATVKGPSGDALPFGVSLATLGDLDGDGLRELAIAEPQTTAAGHFGGPGGYAFFGPGFVQIVDPATGATLATVVGNRWGASFGSTLSALADLDGDGRGELLIGAPDYAVDDYGAPSGRVAIHSSALGFSTPETYCDALAHLLGRTARIGWTGSTSASAADFTLTAQGAIPDRPGYFIAGRGATAGQLSPTPYGALGYWGTGSFLCIQKPAVRLGPAPSSSTGASALTLSSSNLAGAFLAGTTWYFQYAYLYDRTNIVVTTFSSDALAVTFTP